MNTVWLSPRFVENIPDALEAGVLYVSMVYATTIHRCACGCGREVVATLSPTDWQLFFDGENVSLEPSIGNWSFPCRSHYWIRGGAIRWAPEMSQREIQTGRARDRALKSIHYGQRTVPALEDFPLAEAVSVTTVKMPRKTLWDSLKDWWCR